MNGEHHTESRSPLGLIGAGVMFALATVAVVQFMRPSESLLTGPAPARAEPALVAAKGVAGEAAFGKSGSVMLRFGLPNAVIDYPVYLTTAADSMSYAWVSYGDSTYNQMRPLTSAPLIAPPKPGFYQLALLRSGGVTKQILPEPVLAVKVPFDQKIAGSLNGYKIGTYLSERFGHANDERPDGFLEVRPEMLELQITRHLRLSDFVTHDEQQGVWPKYVALSPKLLDKLELVLTELGGKVRPDLGVDVHSGFRTPSHNAKVPRAASDSRHQYGDAADLVIDADADGRNTMTDALLVMLAVERVEDRNPELVGGMGVYTSRRYPVPYVHIDTRGVKKRWKD